ncbi:MAG: ATP-binding protein [Bacteroidales bacterium]|nr:ATP-binding protein [Bacteroidales bacterium]
MDKQIIKRIITERHQEVRVRQLTLRSHHVFENKMNYVLVGIRRAGKSCLMIQDMQQQIAQGLITLEDCLYVNFEDERIRDMEASELGIWLDCYAEMFGTRKPYIYLDEIQIIDGWEHYVRRLADQQYRVMVTGSNAKMLSSEIATTLGGRFVIREVWPFSFEEYLNYHDISLESNWLYTPNILHQVAHLMDSYFSYGGFAENFNLTDKREWLNSLYQKILLGDIVARNGIRNTRVIRLLAKKIAECVTQPVSLSRLQNIVKSTGDSVSLASVKDYLQHFEDSYLTFSLSNFVSPISEKETIKKRYFTDNGLLNNFLFGGEEKLLENLCAIHLLRQLSNSDEPRVYYYNRNIEVDFYVPEIDLAVQASWDMTSFETRERELGALAALHRIRPLRQAVIVTRDQEEHCQMGTLPIEVVPIWKWLLQ